MGVKKTQTDRAKVTTPDDEPERDGWVSPAVLAAQAGEVVEFGKDLDEATQDTTDA